MSSEVTLSGQIDPWPTKQDMAKLLEQAGLSVRVGEYSIRIEDCEHFVFQRYGGDIAEPHVDADASSLDQMTKDAIQVSSALSAANIRHRFEIYDERVALVGYLHHDWPQSPDEKLLR